MAALGGIHPHTIANQPDGTLALGDIKNAIRGDNVHWPRTRLITLLHARAVKDPDAYVRQTAVSALGKHYRYDEQTLALLRDRAINDDSPGPGEERKFWRNYVREVAINALAENWSADPKILDLLRDRAENDPALWLRERAKELADQIEGGK